mgnify:CR=1 FL=1
MGSRDGVGAVLAAQLGDRVPGLDVVLPRGERQGADRDAPRQLDRNIALVGRIIEGMEHMSSLPRGHGDLLPDKLRAIALDNAEAYRQLQDAQTQLVSQEKLAALGSLMAGVAHELNTPIGNSLLAATTLSDRLAEFKQRMEDGTLKRSTMNEHLDDVALACTLISGSLNRAANLISSFKQVAVDRTTEQRRNFNLQQVCHEIIATMMNRVRAADHSIELQVGLGDASLAADVALALYRGAQEAVTNALRMLKRDGLMVPVALMDVAERITKTELRPGTADNDINAVRSVEGGVVDYFVCDYLTSNYAWFVITQNEGLKFFERDPYETDMWVDNTTDNLLVKAYQRAQPTYTDWRAAYGSFPTA